MGNPSISYLRWHWHCHVKLCLSRPICPCLLFNRFLTLILVMIIIGLEDFVLKKPSYNYTTLPHCHFKTWPWIMFWYLFILKGRCSYKKTSRKINGFGEFGNFESRGSALSNEVGRSGIELFFTLWRFNLKMCNQNCFLHSNRWVIAAVL